ncbi:MAG TPA: penicillin-binding protein activator [Pseudolabrys sp.]|jgi:branched-chain amino acid transport system substrate-binding protein
MSGTSPDDERMLTRGLRRARTALSVAAAAVALAACANTADQFGGGTPVPQATEQPSAAMIGAGQVRVGLILPLSAPGNAGVAATSMKNAAEMALAEFKEPNIQLLVKDDAGTPQGAQLAAQQAIDEGAEIIIGPLFAQSVSAVGGVARTRNIPVIAFSTDASVAARGVYLLSFLPESDVKRIVDYAISKGKRSFAALLPDNGYGAVVEAALQQEVARRGGRVVALEKYPIDPGKMAEPIRRVAQAASRVDSIFIADGADAVPQVIQNLAAGGVNPKRVQLLGTGLWDDPRIFSTAALDGGWFAAPESAGFRGFAGRYRARYGQEPVRTATLAYDAVALVAALVKQQAAPQRFSEQTLTAPSGFAGIDGIFRFRTDGTNERGLAVLRVAPAGGQVVSPAPRSFAPGT